MKYKYKGKEWEIKKSPRKDKEYLAKSSKGKKVHFADPDMDESPGTKRGDNYCARSLGIEKKYDPKDSKTTPNDFSRELWSCDGKKSIYKKRFFGKIKGGNLK